MNTIHICTSSDKNYGMFAGVMIASILLNSAESTYHEFHILDGGILQKDKDKIEELKKIKSFNINYYEMHDSEFEDCPLTYLSLATYYRFKIANYLKNVEKVIYFDCDLIVLKDLLEFWNINISCHWIGGCEDPIGNKNIVRLEMPENSFYFNAGVLLINLRKWREDSIENKLFQYVKTMYYKAKFQDQDILNDVLHTKSVKLPLKWNSIHYTYGHTYRDVQEYENALKSPAIIHYAMKDKPWKIESKIFRKKEYFKVLKQTPWKKVTIDGKYTINEYKMYIKWLMNRFAFNKEGLKEILKFRFIFKPIERLIKNKKSKWIK